MAVDTDDDDRMVRPGGPALDDDPNEHIEAQMVGKGKKRGKPAESDFIQISRPPTAPTLKDIRQGRNKWTTHDLPAGSAVLFAEVLTPLARYILDMVFPGDRYSVESPVWHGLIAYRLNDWRNSIIARATTGREKNPEPDDEPDEELDPLTYTRDGFINLKTPQGIAAFVAWATTEVDHTCPFHWREWNDGDAKEIMILDDVPSKYYPASDYKPPIGALILAIQATQHALRAWSTGEFVAPSKATGFFSKDYYADTTKMVNGVKKKHKRSSKYVPSIEAFDDHQWQAIFDRTNSWITAKKKKASSSRSSSMDVDRIEIESDEEEFSVPVSRESRLHS
ncbi:hypothetical protein DFH06DRAFT_1318177 [Mycena polygramma]|nr:hypothetical protein DFH06DRAFT_1318177 [Mycena polygramma]